MKYPLTCLSVFVVLCLIASCSDDEGSVITEYVLSGTSISTSDSNIVLTAGNSGGLALTVYWQNPPVSGGLTLQFSLSSSFEAVYEESLDDDALAAQFTVQELQDIVDGLGAEGGVATKVYLRLSQTASGVTATGSYISITVTPYSTDKSTLYLTTSTGGDFASIPATDDGEYEGFVSTPSTWYNFYFAEVDGTIWGTPNDGSTGSPFSLTTDSDMWNNWFPEPQGLYRVTMSTNDECWTALSLNALTAGDSEMDYTHSTMSWSGVITTSSDGESVSVGGTAWLYDESTGDSSYNELSVGFSGSSDGSLTFSQGSGGSITIPTAGSWTLTLSIEDMTWSVEEYDAGSVVTYDEFLYMYYCWETQWIEQVASVLQCEDGDGEYIGYFSTGSTWDDAYCHFLFGTSSTVADGTSDGTIWGLDPDNNSSLSTDSSSFWTGWINTLGLARITVDMPSLSWAQESLSVAVTGDFNDWSLTSDQMTFDTSTLKWTATVEVDTIGYGIQIVLGSNWEYIYGGTDGTLYLKGSNIVPDETGTYTITVDLSDYSSLSYTITKSE